MVEPASAASGVETTTPSSLVEPASAASGVETTTPSSLVEPASAASGVETTTPSSLVEPASAASGVETTTPSSLVEPASAASGVETTTPSSLVEPASAASGVETTTPSSLVEPASAASGVETTTPGNDAAGGIVINLVMADTQLFGTGEDSEASAHLDGYGPIDADLARQLVKESERVWLRRLYTDPETGQLVQMDSRQRCFPEGLKTLIRLRDQTCRTPWCGAPIRETDHIVEYAHAGATAYLNGQGLCQACNHSKQDNWWARPGPDGSIEITTTTGHAYRSYPPQAPGPCLLDDGLDTDSLRSPGSTNEGTWPAPAWVAQDRQQLLADGWTETTPVDEHCPTCGDLRSGSAARAQVAAGSICASGPG